MMYVVKIIKNIELNNYKNIMKIKIIKVSEDYNNFYFHDILY